MDKVYNSFALDKLQAHAFRIASEVTIWVGGVRWACHRTETAQHLW